MVRLLLRWISLSLAIWLAAYLLTGVSVTGGWMTYAWVALVFGLVNATVGALTKLFTFPITFLTLGLWSFVVNALMLLLTDNISDALAIESFWWALGAAVVISVASAIVNKVVDSFRA